VNKQFSRSVSYGVQTLTRGEMQSYEHPFIQMLNGKEIFFAICKNIKENFVKFFADF